VNIYISSPALSRKIFKQRKKVKNHTRRRGFLNAEEDNILISMIKDWSYDRSPQSCLQAVLTVNYGSYLIFYE